MKSETIKLEPNGAALTSYLHEDEKIRQCVLVSPGGAYAYCSPIEGKPVAEAYYNEGFNSFVLEYSCTDGLYNSPKFPKDEVFDAALEDAMNAFYHIQNNCDKYHIDKDKITMIGFSAGAHLSLSSVVLGKIRPMCLLLGYVPVTDEMMKPLGMKELNLLDKIPEDMPPVFMFLNQGDNLVPSSESMKLALALAEKKLPYEVHTYLTGEHGLSLGTKETGAGDKDYATWFNHSLRFMENVLSPYPYVYGDISDDINNLSIYSRVGALMYVEKAWKLIEEHLPKVAAAAQKDLYIRGKQLERMTRYGLADISELEEIDKILKSL